MVNGCHGTRDAVTNPQMTNTAIGASVAIASAEARRPTGRTPARFSAVRSAMNASARSQRVTGVMPGHQKRTYSTKSAGYTATSTKLSIQLHQPT